MGRLIYLELKRVVSTRTVWIMLAVILLLSAVMAYFPISYMKTKRVDDQGNVIMLEGKAAIDYQKEKEKEINGEVTEEKIRSAIQVFRECYQEYGAVFPPEMPIEEYVRRIEPVYPLLTLVGNTLSPQGVTLYSMTDADIAPEDASKLYEQYRERLILEGKSEDEQEKIKELSKDIRMPFTYISGYEISSYDYMTLYILLMMLVFVVIISPIFSAEYQTGADSILRCTRHGRVRLAIAKIVTAILIFVLTFLIGTGIYILITDLTFGIEGLQTSIQMVWPALMIPGFTAGQTQAAVAAGLFLSMAATVSITLFLSAKCRNVQDSLKIALLLGLLPMILAVISSANLIKIIRCILPSGGIGLTNSFLYELLGTDFAHVGSAVIWTPYLIIGAALVEIPLFLILTVRVYCRREGV